MDFGSLLGGIDGGDVSKALEFITDNKDTIAKLADMPAFLSELAGNLQGAGGEAVKAAVALVGDDGQSGARAALETASTAMTGILGSVEKGIAMVEQSATAISKVPLMDGPAKSLSGAAKELGDSTGNLGELAEAMTKVAAVLGTVGEALHSLGGYLDTSGNDASKFAGKG